MSVGNLGAAVLGAMLGYVTHYLVRRDAHAGPGDLTAIVASLLGGVALNAFAGQQQTNWYFVGLGAGFFLYWLALMAGRERPSSAAAEAQGNRRCETRRPSLFPFLRARAHREWPSATVGGPNA